MGFLEFVGGLVIFGFLWFIIPRASFAGLLIYTLYGILTTPEEALLEGISMALLIIVGILGGLVLDIAEHKQSKSPYF